jgi:nucleoside-diphosphate-sugar epimerase
MRHVLVTGAGGYIGTTLVPILLAAGYGVRALDRFFFGQELLPEHPRLEQVRADVRHLTPEHLAGIDAVVDLAALSNDASGERFKAATLAVNYRARARCCELARSHGVARYVLPSSCSVYGFSGADRLADETARVNPLTTYARANLAAERATLAQASPEFCVVVLRQATVFGWSPRMRFDLAINGMTWGGFAQGAIPLMRDGSQWRPMVHVRDAASAILWALEAPTSEIGGEIFNIGSAATSFRLAELAEIVAGELPERPRIEWYGDPDQRSYRVAFEKIEARGWRARISAEEGIRELVGKLSSGEAVRTPQTVTLTWYEELERWHRITTALALDGKMIELGEDEALVSERP